MSVSSRRVVCGIVIIIFALASPAIAQNSSHLGTPAESKTGQSGVSTYARDKIETVNLANGNFSLSIPLATVGGRGSAGYTVALSYNSKVWTSEHDVEDVSLMGDLEDVPPETPPAGPIRNLYTAVYDKLEEYEPGLAKLGGGWTIRLTPGIKALTFGVNPVTTSRCGEGSDEPPRCGYKFVLTKMWLTLPDGSQVELRDKATQGTPAIAPLSRGFSQLIDRDRGRVWQSIDGSGVIFVRDAGYPVGQVGGPHFPSGWVFLPDGTRIRMVDGAGNRIIDRNGNFVDIDMVSYTDQLGRQTVLTSSANTVTVTVKGYLGTPDRSTTIHLGVIGENLRSHFQLLPRPFTTGDSYRDTQGNYFEHMAPLPHTDLFDQSEGIKHYGSYGEDVGARSAVTGLTLLDGRSFGFRYNQYGEVAEIVYPGGGVSQIDYSGGNSGICQINSQMGATFNRRVSERRTLSDGTNVDATWVYGHGGLNLVDGVYYPTTSVDAHQGDATGPLLASEKHYFLKLGLGAEYRACQTGEGTGNEKWENAKEFRSEMQTGTGMIVTRRNWQQRAPLVWVNDGPSGYLQQAGQDQPSNDDRVTWEETTLEDGKVKRVEYAHDQFNNVTSIKEYHFGTAVSPGTLLRQTFRTYATTINGYCYNNLNPVDGSCGSGLATDVNSIIYQPRLLLSETVKDAANNQKAHAVFEYDNYTSEPNHAPVSLNTGMIQYDGSRFATLNSATQPRGNVTKVTRWLNGGTDVVAYNQYDNAGQVIWSKEPNGNVATVLYNDNFGDGTNPEPGSGVPGPAGPTFAMASMSTNALGHQVKMQYDYSLGATGVKDANGVITKTEYDNLGRPFRVTSALGLTEQSISEMSYPSVIANEALVSKQLDTTSGITRWLSSKTVFDSFDRAITSWQAEDGQHASSATFTIRTNSVYDAIGRVKQVSNPYRSATETPVYTTTAYDIGGRVISLSTPDNAVVSTAYSGDLVLVTDQAGRQRMSRTNALGQLKDVWEITTADSATEAVSFPGHPEVTAGYRTSYSYDLLDNLTSVTQGVQPPRTFVYDSLKRLTAVFNPESGNTAYQYDANGNLKQKTDSRGVITTYTYDALNRNTTVNYSDTSITPDLTRLYDTGTNGKGRQRESYAGGNETAGATVEHTKIQSYDALGRPLDQRQRFKTSGVWSAEYKTLRGYNRVGGVAAQTYPSGRTVSYAYDNAGRTNSFSGNLGDGVARTYASAIIYNALGAKQQEQFGTQTPLFHKLHYNVRGQLNDIRLSTVNWAADQWNWNRGALLNYYSQAELICQTAECRANSGPGNNGNVVRSQHWIPVNDQMSSYHSTEQRYLYDKLNRLTSVAEYPGTQSGLGPMSFTQIFDYDRWGNRTINPATTNGLPETQFVPSSGNNRLGVPAGSSGRMDYDAAGNLINDTHTSFGRADGLPTRLYDAENRLITAKDGNLQVVSSYFYNADGQRVRRTINGLQTWQVYGMDGELLAEYPRDGAPSSPQTEYGYRDGTLLISTTNGGTGSPSSQNVTWTNVAGVAISGNSITKNVANGWGNSGAASTQSLTSGDGYVEFTPTYLGGLRACGLSNGDSNQNYTDIDFAIVIGYGYGHTYRVWEGGVQKYIGPTFYEATDRFRVAVEAGVVKYYRNGALFYTSASTPVYPLLVDTAIYTNGYPITNVVLTATSTTQAEVRWMVTDQLGSPRITVDQTGSLANAKRHDYLPFGEELVAGTGGRTTGQGYSGDKIRQKFTQYERDNETGLDYAQARYYASAHGRFTSPDPLLASAKPGMPQSWSRYTYCLNNPLAYVDPDGLKWYKPKGAGDTGFQPVWYSDDPGGDYEEITQHVYWGGDEHGWVGLDPLSETWKDGFKSRDEAVQFIDPGQEVSLIDGISEMSTFTGVGGIVRGGFSFGASFFANTAAKFFGRQAAGLADETATGGVQIFQRVISNAELEATQASGLLRGGRQGTNFFTNAASLDAKRAQIRLGLDGPLRDVRITFRMADDVKIFGPQRVGPGTTGTPGRGLEFFTNGPTRINVMRVEPLKK